MKVTFNFAEHISFSDIIDSVKESAQYKGADENGNEIYVIRDERFGAESKILVNSKEIHIRTYAGYEYGLEPGKTLGPTALGSTSYIGDGGEVDGTQCTITYSGAYRGLLQQELLPPILREHKNYDLQSLLFSNVKNSFGGYNCLQKYAGIQQNLHIMRVNDSELESNDHAHPQIVYEMIQAGWFPELPKLEYYEVEGG